MNLSDQVCSLELAKRLKELGVEQESIVYWLNIQDIIYLKVKENGWEVEKDENGAPIIDRIDYRIELGNPAVYNIDEDNRWSAFTVAELGEMLPNKITIDDFYKDLNLRMEREGNEFIITYEINYFTILDCNSYENMKHKKEADARAKMLIYLIENKLIEVLNES